MQGQSNHYLTADEVLSAVNIVTLVGRYVSLKKQGANYVGLCPFHGDRRPSLFVSESKQIFKCFACGVGGNAIRFVSLADKLPYGEAIMKVADLAGIKYAKYRETDDKLQKLRNDIRSVNKEAARFFFNCLKNSDKPKRYLESRKIFPETVGKFGIGYAPDSWDALYNHFHSRGISDELIVKAGLATPKTGGGFNDRFHDRLMFPIFDDSGNVVAFGGRVMDSDAKTAKYINTQETAVYVKGEHLYGLNIAKKSSSKTVMIVEGYMDCIALHQKNIDFAVASLGTALTQKQARLIKRYFEEVIVAFDNDAAGKEATLRSLDIVKEAGLSVKVFRLQGAKDCDEYLRTHTKEELLSQLKESASLFEYKCAVTSEKYPPGTNENAISFINALKKLLYGLPDTDRDVYKNWVFEIYGSRYGFTKDMLSGNSGQAPDRNGNGSRHTRIFIPESEYGVPETDEDLSEDAKRTDAVEKNFLLCLSENPEFYRNIKNKDVRSLFTSEINRQIFDVITDLCEKGLVKNYRDIPPINPSADNALAGAYLSYNISKDNSKKAFEELLLKMSSHGTKSRLALLQKLIDDPSVPRDDRIKYLKEFQTLNSKK